MSALSGLSVPLPVASAQISNAPSQPGEGRRKKKITRRVGYGREPSEEGPPAKATAVGPSMGSRPEPAVPSATAVGLSVAPEAAPAASKRELPTPAHSLVAAGRVLMPHAMG